jgi:hypothetical protein
MTKHTPGPWEVITSQHTLPQVYSAWRDDSRECITDRVFNGNANLIAAAPELLAALSGLMAQAVKDAEHYAPEGNEPIWAFIADASDAITKATN